MSDLYYQQQAARRRRIWIIAGGLALAFLCIAGVLLSLYYDACTRSFDRSPRAVVVTYVEAIERGDLPAAQECWEHQAYYDLGAGCSEVCLGRVLGAGFQIQEVRLAEPLKTTSGRSSLAATVSIACTASGTRHTADILLDSVGSNVPWKHWAIVDSGFGGTVADPWCK